MPILSTLLEAALTWAAERVIDKGSSAFVDRLSNNAAKSELLEIIRNSIEAAIAVAPSLAEDFRSEVFLHSVIAPLAIDRIKDPTLEIDPNALSKIYISRFVAQWVKNEDENSVLTHVFQTEHTTIVSALSEFIAVLRTQLFASHHWVQTGRDRTIEEMHRGISYLVEREKRFEPEDSSLDLKAAKADAYAGSRDLLDWQRTIEGLFIKRPELDLLLSRVRSEPRGRTLLVGEAGSGKSALLSEITERLHREGMTVFGLKADMLPPNVTSSADISRSLGLRGDLEGELHLLAQSSPVVLVIDQLDAVSDIMDRSSQRMKMLLRIANGFRRDQRFDDGPPVHVLLSSRPFEAAHDARFQSLGAEIIQLELPSQESVEGFLLRIGISASMVPSHLRETIRRPFALRLFVELVRRHLDVSSIKSADLLNFWLLSANLGDQALRPRVITFFERLAMTMTATETLWRPADTFDAEFADAVCMGEAAGLIIRQQDKIGFSHQSWLDDFQAKGFTDGQSVAAFAWDRQDGLFSRATLLRALERLRRHDLYAYYSGIDNILGDNRTRRHIKHLVVDLIASQDNPLQREQAWIQRLFRTDVALARRAASQISSRWSGWRMSLKPLIPELMRMHELRWTAAQLIQAESCTNPADAIEYLENEWTGQAFDIHVFQAISRGKLWSPWVSNRMREILRRQRIQDYAVAIFIKDLVEGGRPVDGIELLKIYLDVTPFAERQNVRLRGLGNIVDAAPCLLAEVLTDWFITLLSNLREPTPSIRHRFPHTYTLPYHWDDDEHEDGIFDALRASLIECAKTQPESAGVQIAKLMKIPIDEAQALAAYVFSENADFYSEDAANFLLSDTRRFYIGVGHFTDEQGSGHTIHGHATKQLLTAISPHLEQTRLGELKNAIEAWDPYNPDVWENDTAADRRRRRRWTEEARFELLDCLPNMLLDARKLRQIGEWRAKQPILVKERLTAHCVGSPMSAEQMSKASDDDLMGMLDDCGDSSGWGDRRSKRHRHISKSGGAIQVSQELAGLGKTDPHRVLRLVKERLKSDKHQRASGSAIVELSSLEEIDPATLATLIHELWAQGFNGAEWQRDAAWAFEKIARRSKGLRPVDLELIEGWIIDDHDVARERTRQRLESEATSREHNENATDHASDNARPLIFGRGLGGFSILPQDNYAFLSAMASGVLCQDPFDCNHWLAILERHVLRADDHAIWSAILTHHGRALYWSDRDRTHALFEALWRRFPEAFDVGVGQRLWSYRAMIPVTVQLGFLQSWLTSGQTELMQAAGEFIAASALVGKESDVLTPLAATIIDGPSSPHRLGCLFAAASAWRDNAGTLRQKAHELLVRIAPSAEGDDAKAISTALDGGRSLLSDNATEQMLRIALSNDALLSAAMTNWFADALQELLLHPGFEDIVLDISEKGAEMLIADRNKGGGRGMVDSDLVTIAIALQRAEGKQRGRAMDLYERLLDAEVYGASEAAAAALRA